MRPSCGMPLSLLRLLEVFGHNCALLYERPFLPIPHHKSMHNELISRMRPLYKIASGGTADADSAGSCHRILGWCHWWLIRKKLCLAVEGIAPFDASPSVFDVVNLNLVPSFKVCLFVCIWLRLEPYVENAARRDDAVHGNGLLFSACGFLYGKQ